MSLTRDLKSRAAIIAKAFLFLVLGALSSTILLLQFFSWPHLALLLIAIWSFSRAYYFAFYVIEKYIDGSFRYAGLLDCCLYLLKGKQPGDSDRDQSAP